jgi:hypothetical protein
MPHYTGQKTKVLCAAISKSAKLELRRREKVTRSVKIRERRKRAWREACEKKSDAELAALLKERLCNRTGRAFAAEIFMEAVARLDPATASTTSGLWRTIEDGDLAGKLQERVSSVRVNAEELALVTEASKRLRTQEQQRG